MSLPTRQMLMGMALGATCATLIAAIGPGQVVSAFADEAVAGFDTDNLVKFDDREYRIDYEPWVATTPITSSRVKKIEGGRVTYVDIATTETGTYSTDGLTSPHVQYPGIDVTPVETPAFYFSQWSNGQWIRFASRAGKSFVSIGRH